MVSIYLTHGCLHFKLTETMIPNNYYLLRVNGKYIKSKYKESVLINNRIVHVFTNHWINSYLNNDYIYELIPKKQFAQQAMEKRAYITLLQQITGDPYFKHALP